MFVTRRIGAALTQAVVNFLYAGSVYALFAVGYSLVYAVSGVANFAHPVSFTVAALLTLTFVQAGHPLWLAALDGAIAGGVAGVIVERVTYYPLRLRGTGPIEPLVAGIAAAIICAGAVAAIFGNRSHAFPAHATQLAAAHFGRVTVDGAHVAAVCVCAAALLCVLLIFRGTRLGSAIRALAENPTSARSVGINVEAVIAQTTFAASLLGAVAGIAFAVAGNRVDPRLGFDIQLVALAAAVLGGLGSVTSTIAAAYIVAIVQISGAAAFPAMSRDAVAFWVIITAVVLLPGGIAPRRALRQM